ncbi:hypothetical protein DRO60_00560 [Candidatus Bathyarchaeota archaeon]|nr:MAG: hypothetical protein DRO60_00560 [Candidatus Bathyarchaeota archaeon]
MWPELPERGVYTLVICLEKGLAFDAGSLGRVVLRPGFYLYTGSGLGPGPLSLRGRVRRHLGARKKPFWHIDYLLEQSGARVVAVVASPSLIKEECRVNQALIEGLEAEVPVRGFGSSDCRSGCPAHLLYAGREDPSEAVLATYRRLGLRPVLLRPGR